MYQVRVKEGRTLAVLPRPRAGDWLEDEVKAFKRAGIAHVVSLLTVFEVWTLELNDERSVCESLDVSFYNYPVHDNEPPASALQTRAFLAPLLEAYRRGEGVGVHSRTGIGRASLIVACLLVLDGMSAADAWDVLEEARGLEVPQTREQREWLASFEGIVQAGLE